MGGAYFLLCCCCLCVFDSTLSSSIRALVTLVGFFTSILFFVCLHWIVCLLHFFVFSCKRLLHCIIMTTVALRDCGGTREKGEIVRDTMLGGRKECRTNGCGYWISWGKRTGYGGFRDWEEVYGVDLLV